MNSIDVEVKNEKLIQYLGLFLLLITAYFSEGYYRMDEYNLLECANYILGERGYEKESWEFQTKIRPAFQPMLSAFMIKLSNSVGVSSPFDQTLIMRLTTALFFFFVSKLSVGYFKRYVGKRVLLPVSFLLWFVVFIGVRFSSETWSALWFMLAFLLWFKWGDSSTLKLLIIGSVVGLAFQFRYQTGVMSLGFLMWLVFVKKEPIRVFLFLFLGFFFVFCVGCVLDYFMYGEWVLAPWNYFYQNIVEDKISGFGVHSWYHFIPDLLNKTYVIYGLFILIGFAFFSVKKPLSAVGFVVVPFVVFHSSVGHKEMRFLFPLIFFIPLYVSFAYDLLSRFKVVSSIVKVGFMFSNVVFLLLVVFFSFDSNVKLTHEVFSNLNVEDRLYVIEDNPYDRDCNIGFYHTANGPEVIEVNGFDDFSKNENGRDYVYVVNKAQDQKYEIPGNSRLIFQSLPLLLTSFNVNNWVDRTTIARFYEIEK